jgi:hypothetical protein
MRTSKSAQILAVRAAGAAPHKKMLQCKIIPLKHPLSLVYISIVQCNKATPITVV